MRKNQAERQGKWNYRTGYGVINARKRSSTCRQWAFDRKSDRLTLALPLRLKAAKVLTLLSSPRKAGTRDPWVPAFGDVIQSPPEVPRVWKWAP